MFKSSLMAVIVATLVSSQACAAEDSSDNVTANGNTGIVPPHMQNSNPVHPAPLQFPAALKPQLKALDAGQQLGKQREHCFELARQQQQAMALKDEDKLDALNKLRAKDCPQN